MPTKRPCIKVLTKVITSKTFVLKKPIRSAARYLAINEMRKTFSQDYGSHLSKRGGMLSQEFLPSVSEFWTSLEFLPCVSEIWTSLT